MTIESSQSVDSIVYTGGVFSAQKEGVCDEKTASYVWLVSIAARRMPSG